MKDGAIVFLQQEFENLPAGTPLIRTKMSSAHAQAAALVGNPEPSGYYHIPGKPDYVIRVPLFKDLIGEMHPKDKELIGPFVPGRVISMYDYLPKDKACIVVFEKEWPYVNAILVMNKGDQYPNASIHFEKLPECVGREDFLTTIDDIIKVS